MSDITPEPLEPSDGDEVVTGVDEESTEEKETKPDAS